MNIIGIAACTAGIAHTYIAKEKLITAAKNAGHNIHIETQGTIGVQDEIPDELIESADIVILAIDVKVSGRERFANKKIIEVPTEIAIKSPNKLIKKIEEAISQ
ncbi:MULTISPECIES: PTS fructose transporter subunit IIB [Gilliamella]|uniref:protein-N(pi)-phosphohistidine--D-fructose phosphotransferase n=1 Tax=Gilliamella apis TaxID=1970738 RepID=A0A2V4DPE5_9GAMM|nr:MULTISPECIES: fructose PTS transporter subunit IIB [Gilliamella]MCT6867932.1 fructose PTS transporter subunit IIB [Gilliamella apicola]MBI0006332.1 PTS fructose transporter subunit IIB [Gilliamella sp. W8126]MBI0038838.1 PTS fructose transporter subunit IIB [Gilliamella sp. B14384G10]MBI0041131.1 PTS fructose transporter subunit IIB [Gilliamella sp. B14384G7]MBI0052830.1 PTS fructose transporter subunit IIB [Gilliamella sp. B14384G13]